MTNRNIIYGTKNRSHGSYPGAAYAALPPYSFLGSVVIGGLRPPHESLDYR